MQKSGILLLLALFCTVTAATAQLPDRILIIENLMRQGDFDRALQTVEEELAISAPSPDLLFLKGICCSQIERLRPQATDIFYQALGICQEWRLKVSILYHIARMYRLDSEPANAIRIYNHLLEYAVPDKFREHVEQERASCYRLLKHGGKTDHGKITGLDHILQAG
ncbi:MAG: hypothetical protein LBR65_09205 [Culturomica sp.]|nr:hypothetical protein [Culturomica sp.]